jgi:hypothetical protein
VGVRNLPPFHLALALLALAPLAACGPGPSGHSHAPPVASYDEVFGGVPANDALPELKADGLLPATFLDLLPLQTPVRDQGQRGICSIFSTVALMEHLYLRAGARDPDFSEQFLQWAVKSAPGAAPGEASNAGVNLQVIADGGIPEEGAWPYQPRPWGAADDPRCVGPELARPTVPCYTDGTPSAAARAAPRFRLPAGRFINTRSIKAHLAGRRSSTPSAAARAAPRFRLPAGRFINTRSIKAHLAGRRTAVAVGIDFFYQAWGHADSTLPTDAQRFDQGVVGYPNATDIAASHQHKGGHAVLIVGWDDQATAPLLGANGRPLVGADGRPLVEKGFYVVKNSWGTSDFGTTGSHGAGYGLLSQRYVEDFGSAYVSDVPGAAPAPAMPERFDGGTATSTSEGMVSQIDVGSVGPIAQASLTLDVDYVGDLSLVIAHNDLTDTVTFTSPVAARPRTLTQTIDLPDFVGADRGGPWKLTVQDSGRRRVLKSWSLDVR